jgi:hypothetical protein
MTMQAVEIKRVTVHRIGIAAVAIGTLVAGIAGANAFYDAIQDSEVGAFVETRVVSRPSAADTYRFLEWNNNLPARSTEPVQQTAEIQFLEWNTLLPGTAAPRVDANTTRFLEINVLPGDDARYLPGPSESQAAGTPY